MVTNIALGLMLSILTLYGTILFLFFKFQRRLVFQRFPFECPPPIPGHPEASQLTIDTADGEKLDAIWMPAVTAECAPMLYLHGNAATLRCRARRIQKLNELGFSILAIDWRGYGKSTGTPSQSGLQLDAEAALLWLQQRKASTRIVVFAESIGTGVAIELVAKHDVGALILEAPYYSAVSLAKAYLPFFPVGMLMLDHLRSDLWIGKIRTNLLILHGQRDCTVPFRQGMRLFSIAPHPKRLIAYPKGGHYDLPEKHNSYKDLKEFVVECFSPNSRPTP